MKSSIMRTYSLLENILQYLRDSPFYFPYCQAGSGKGKEKYQEAYVSSSPVQFHLPLLAYNSPESIFLIESSHAIWDKCHVPWIHPSTNENVMSPGSIHPLMKTDLLPATPS